MLVMKYYIVSSFLLSVLMLSCTKISTSISAICELDRQGNYVVKWEIYPDRNDAFAADTIVEIYASDDDMVFPQNPIQKVNANKFIAVIENADSLGYCFFRLKVGDTYSDVISNRFYELDEVLNFRDLGGYEASDSRKVRWRKIFRSGELSSATDKDIEVARKLNVKTIIDFRSKNSQVNRKDKVDIANRYELYVGNTTIDSVKKEVLQNRFLRGDAIIFMQDTYEDILLNQADKYRQFFDLLADEDNYPVLFHCSMGKDQTGVAAYFLLRALGVATELSEDDYMLSNIGIDKSRIVDGVLDMTDSQQEAFTMLARTDISYLRYALACVKKTDGSVDDYMTNRLGLTKEKREKLKQILLSN